MEIDQMTRNQIELRRSRVRQVITYGAGALIFIITAWGLMWMGDRTLATAGVTVAVGILGYWFGERSASKRNNNQ